MRRFIPCALLLAAAPAHAAITFYGAATSPADGGSQDASAERTITPPASMTAGQLVFVIVTNRLSSGTMSNTTSGGQSWSVVGAADEVIGGTGTTEAYCAIFDGTWTTDPGWTKSGTNSSAFSLQMIVYSPSGGGTLSCTPDVALAYNENLSGTTHTITGQTPTASASVVTIAVWRAGQDFLTWGSLTGGWTTRGTDDDLENTTGGGLTISIADKIQGSAAATGDVSNTSSASSVVEMSIVTFKETVSSGGSFTSGPSVTAVDNNTYRVTYTATAGGTLDCGAYLKDAATPTAAQIDAGTNAHGTGNEATTGSSDTLDFDVSDSPANPVYDVYCVVETAGPTYSMVSDGDNLDVCLDPPSNFQYINCPTGLTSVASDSVPDAYNDANFVTLAYDAQSANFTLGRVVVGGTSGAYGIILLDTDAGTTGTLTIDKRSGTFSDNEALTDASGGAALVNGTASNITDIATGDILVVPSTVSPSSAALTVGVDGNFSYTASGRQTALNGLVYDVSAAAYMAVDLDAYFNNQAPACAGPTGVLVFTVDEATSGIDLDDFCIDGEDDSLTYGRIVGTIPTGLSLAPTTGLFNGTPTVEDEAGEVLTFLTVDAATDTDTFDVQVYPIESWTLDDYRNTPVIDAEASIETLTFNTVGTETTLVCNPSVVVGDVISHSPAGNEEVVPGDTVEMSVSVFCSSQFRLKSCLRKTVVQCETIFEDEYDGAVLLLSEENCPSSAYGGGLIWAQTPAPKDIVDAFDTVTVEYCGSP